MLLLFSSLPAFPWGLRGQQFEIKPPNFMAFHHIYHYAWVKFQVIPSKIFIIIGLSSSRSPNCSFSHLLWQVKLVWGLFWGILFTWLNDLSEDLSIWRSNGSMPRNFWISELHTFFNSVTPLSLCKNLISNACTCDRNLSVITQDSLP